jgi:hypothetical protein
VFVDEARKDIELSVVVPAQSITTKGIKQKSKYILSHDKSTCVWEKQAPISERGQTMAASTPSMFT